MDYYSDLEKKIAALGPEDINAAIRKHLAPKKLVVIHGGDFKKASQ
jgi:zinc protease